MNQFRDFFDQFSAKMMDFYNNLTVTRKIVLFAIVGIVFSAFLSLFLNKKETTYQTLYTDLSEEDIMAIEGTLRKKKISGYHMSGTSLRVPKDKAMDIRLELSQEGLPSGGMVGWEMFDKSNFAVTDFELNINKKRAIEGELSRTINRLDPVRASRVHIVTPKRRLFLDDKTEPTAAIYLKMKQGQVLTKKQVRGIQFLVARSVEGLKSNNITIVDQEGQVLTEEEGSLAPDKLSKGKTEYKKRVEKEYVGKIKSLIGRIVGPEKVMAAVTAGINFKQVSVTTEQYDPDQQVLRSTQVADDEMKGTGLNPTGIPGSKANLPGEDMNVEVSKNSSSQKRSTQTLNYEIGKSISRVVENIGNVEKLSVSVLVDGKYAPGKTPADPPVYTPRTKEEMEKIASLVRQAVGFDQKRGDQLTIENMRFLEDNFAVEERKAAIMQEKKIWRDMTMIAAVALSLIFFFVFVAKPYLKWLSYDPKKLLPVDAEVEEFSPDFDKAGLKKIEIQEEVPFEKLSPRDQIMYLAKHEPVKTTEALRMMMSPGNR